MEEQNVEKKSNSKLILIAVIVGVIIIGIIIFFIVKKTGGLSEDSKLLGGHKNNKLDVPYYGTIEIGDLSIDMLSNEDDLKEAGFERGFLTTEFENPNTDDEFSLINYDYEHSEQTNIRLYNDTLEKYNINGYGNISKNIKLPKNITYNSTVDDVIKAYGEPTDQSDLATPTTYSFDEVEGFSGKLLYYRKHVDENNSIELELYFDNKTQKLYMVDYIVQLEK